MPTGGSRARKNRYEQDRRHCRCSLRLGDRLGRGRRQGDPAAEMGHPGPVRRLLRRQGQGLLRGGRARRDDQAGRPGHRPAAGDRRRRRRRDRRLDALGARQPREGRAPGQHRPAVQALGHDADLPQGHRHHQAGGLPRQDAGRLVLRQRVSVPVLDGEARHPDRRLGRGREGAQAGLQRRSAAAEAGRLHLDHDLQRVLAGDRRRHQARGPDRLQVRGPGRRDARGRPLRAARPTSRTRPSSTRWPASSRPR